MKKHRILKGVIIGALVGVFTIGGVSVGVWGSQISNALKADALFQQLQINKRRSASLLMAQLMVPPTILNPLTVCVYAPPAKPDYEAEVMAQETKVTTNPGEDFIVSIFVKNTGNVAWFGDSSGCAGTNYTRLGTAKEQDRNSIFYNPGDSAWLAANRISMVEPRVDPGEIATFTFKSVAPHTTDIFREYFQPLTENVGWMDAKAATAHVDVSVGATGPEYDQAIFYLGVSGQASTIDLTQPMSINVSIAQQKMWVRIGDTLVREYLVSTGTFKTPTPLGHFKILVKQDLRIAGEYPHYHMPQWMGFTQWGHGLHALPYLENDRGVFWNEALGHIGQRVSHGCIRLLPDDAVELFNIAQVGTAVNVGA